MIKFKIHKTRVSVLLNELDEKRKKKVVKLLRKVLSFEDEGFERLQRTFYAITNYLRYNPNDETKHPEKWEEAKTKLNRLKWVEDSDGTVCFLSENKVFGTYSFGIGFLPDVKELLDTVGVAYKIIKEKGLELDIQDIELPKGIEDRGYQKKAVMKFLKKRRGIIELPTGSGKTEVARQIICTLLSILIKKKDVKTLFLTDSKTLTVQTKDYFKRILKRKVGLITGGKKFNTDSNITCATVQTILSLLKKKPKWTKKFLESIDFYIADECHLFTSTKRIRLLKRMINSEYTLFLSATPYSRFKRLKNARLKDFSGGVIFSVPEYDLIKQEFLAIQEAIFFKNFSATSMLNRWEANRFDKVYQKMVVENQNRNKLAKEIFEELKRYNIKGIFLVEKLEHGEILFELFGGYADERIVFLSGKDDVDLRKKAIRDLQEDNIDCIITSNIFKKGVDIPLLDCVVNMSGYKSDVGTTQMKGRMSRRVKGKKERSLYIDFYDSGKFLEDHSLERIKTLKLLKVPIKIRSNEKIKIMIKKFARRRKYAHH
jgi:superfamily II DNA or RNA helicase